VKSLSAFLKATIVGGAIYMVPIVVILVVLGKVHSVASKVVAPMTAQLELHDIGGIHLARLLAIVAVVLVCFAAGLFARTDIARRFVRWLEHAILSNVPGYSVERGSFWCADPAPRGSQDQRPSATPTHS
jgi:uncharacterized membrane protein